MLRVGRVVKGFPLLRLHAAVPDDDGDRAGQHIAEFLPFVGLVGIGGTAGIKRHADGFHHVLLCVGNDPFHLIVKFRVGLLEEVLAVKDDLLIVVIAEEIFQVCAEAL